MLNHERDAKGRRLKIVNINVPSTLYLTKEEARGLQITDAIIRPENNRLAGSYINFICLINLLLFLSLVFLRIKML